MVRVFRCFAVGFGLLLLLAMTACGPPAQRDPVTPEAPELPEVSILPEQPAAPTPASAERSEPTRPAAVAAATAVPKPATAPDSGRWIDVDVSHLVVRLMDGKQATKTISPVAVGRQIDTGVYESTATGLFHVYSKTAELTYDPPYDTYIANWVGFDPRLDNGFHSFLEDKTGKVVDASTGRVSNGCIRTGDSAAIFAYATMGMPVFVHT